MNRSSWILLINSSNKTVVFPVHFFSSVLELRSSKENCFVFFYKFSFLKKSFKVSL